MASQKYSSLVMLLPREFPSSGFEVIDPYQTVEEERLPFYRHEDYYPMQIGAVNKHRYQVVAKLGYGASSTVWLCHDLRERLYWVLKVHVNTSKHNQELEVYRHLAGVTTEHSDRGHIRRLEDSFKLKGLTGEHDVLVMTPLSMSLRALQEMQKNGIFQQTLVVGALNQVLTGLNFLHEAGVIHTDIHSDNLLIAITNDSVLCKLEGDEIRKPSARKQIGNTVIYVSRYMLGCAGPLTICDLGQARIGDEYSGEAMPVPYRAPEVILNMKWGNAVDMECRALTWDVYDHESEERNDAYHLATMTALLGPPPPEFLNRSKETSKYWDEDGARPLTYREDIGVSCQYSRGDDRHQFLDFVKCLLCWVPEERLTTGQAYYHPWLRERS